MKIIKKMLMVIAVLFVSFCFTNNVKAATEEVKEQDCDVIELLQKQEIAEGKNLEDVDVQYEILDTHESGTLEFDGVARTTYSTTIVFVFKRGSNRIDIKLTLKYYYSDGQYIEIYEDDYSIEHANRVDVVWAYEVGHHKVSYSDSERFVLSYEIIFLNDLDNRYGAFMYIDIDYWGNITHDSYIEGGGTA